MRLRLLRLFRRVARHQLCQAAAITGGDLHHLAGTALQHAARGGVAAQKGRGFVVDHAQPCQQAFGAVAGAGEVGAGEFEVEVGERLELCVQAFGLDFLDDDALRQVGGVRRHGCDAERDSGKAHQPCDQRAIDGAAMLLVERCSPLQPEIKCFGQWWGFRSLSRN